LKDSRIYPGFLDILSPYGYNLMVQVLVSHLCCVHAYSRVVEICLAAAAKRDPQGLALHYYKSGTGSSACRLFLYPVFEGQNLDPEMEITENKNL
jgi:hypothetical protein